VSVERKLTVILCADVHGYSRHRRRLAIRRAP